MKPSLEEKNCTASETSVSWSLGFTDRFVGPESNSEDDWVPQGSFRNL